jgi:hypothetical protein
MVYSVKVDIAPNMSIDVSGDELALVVKLLNETTKKFFPMSQHPKLKFRKFKFM